jgi:tetratricopeptide (TPR) repeat protein
MDTSMARRYFNWTLAIVLVVAVAVFAGAVFTLHRWQRSKGAERALPRGEQAYAQENWDEAADQLGRYINIHNNAVPVLLKYANAQLRRRPQTSGHVQQAIGAYQSILRLNEDSDETLEAAKRLVEFYLSPGVARPGEAEQTALQSLQKKDDPELRRLLAAALDQERKLPEAVKTLRNLIKDHPDDVLSYGEMARLAQDHPADVNVPAADWLDKAVAANPQSAMAYIIRGAFRRQSGNRDQAMADFEQAGRCDLSDAEVHLRLAQELIRTNALDKAKEHLTAVQAKAPKDVMLWQTRAAVALLAGSAEEKAAIAEAGLKELAAYPWDFMPTAAELFVAANQPDKALDCISQMRQRGMQRGLLAFLDGLVAGAKGNLWDAVKRWQEAVTQGHTVHEYAGRVGEAVFVRMLLASSYTQLGDAQSASGQLQTLISESSTYDQRYRRLALLEGHLTLAQLMTRTRNWSGVLEHARAAQQAAPVYREARMLDLQAQIFLLADADPSAPGRQQTWQVIENGLAELDKAMDGAVQVKLLWAQALSRQGKSAEAAKLLEEARSKDPSDVRAILLQADILAGQNKTEEAVTLLRSTIERLPQAIEPVQSLARILNRRKDLQQCESVIRAAMARMQQPDSRRELGLFLADLYRFWAKDDDLYKLLMEMAGQFPNDIQIKRRLLACLPVAKDVKQAQTLVDQIKLLEGPSGWQWRYEQARVWLNSEGFADHYTQASTFLQENLRSNPNDQASRLLLAAAHEEAGQKRLALTTYHEALSRSPSDIDIVTQTVAALFRSGGDAERDEAIGILKQAGERQLHYYVELEKLDLYGQGLQWRDQVRRRDLESASDTLQRLVQRDPNDISASLWLARISMQQNRLDEAEVILRSLEAKSPQLIAVIQAKVQLSILRGNVQEALQMCNDTIQKNSQAAAYLLRAGVYATLKENDKAIEDFKQAVARDPNNAEVWMDRAGFYQSLGRREEAIQDVRKALSLPGGAAPILERAIPLCLASGSRTLVGEAEAALDKARAADPNDASLKLLKAQFLLNQRTRQSTEDGQRLLREVTAARPELSQAWHLLGRLELAQGQPARALDTALSGLSRNERDRDLLLLKADAEAVRSPALAVPTLTQLLDQHPDDIEVEMRLASAQYRSGKQGDGRAILDARMKADPNNWIPVATLASLLASDQHLTEAADQVTNWSVRHPDDAVVVSAVARSLVATGNAEALKVAEKLLNAAVERNPKSVAVVNSLAMLMQSSGRTAEAATLNRRVLELDPNDPIALNNLAWILCEDDHRYQEALELADRGLKVAPDYADLLDTRGVALYRLGQFDKAVEDFSRCVDLYPANARATTSSYFHLARAHAKLGHTDQAQQYLKKAMDLQARIGGLSAADLAEANLLTEPLQKSQ